MEILMHILIDGLILAGVGLLMIVGIGGFIPRLFLQDFPPEVQALVPPKTAQEKRLSLVVGLPFVLFTLAWPVYSAWRLSQMLGSEFGFWVAFANVYGVFMIFNLFDLLVIDLLLVCLWTPKFVMIPGTESAVAAYKDFSFHLKAHAPTFVVMAVLAATVAGVMVFLL